MDRRDLFSFVTVIVCLLVPLARGQEATRFTIHPNEFIGPPLVGFGAQFNPYLYCTPNFEPGGDVTAGNVADLERKLRDLRPQHVRIFFQPQWWERGGRDEVAKDDPRLKESFLRVAALAQACGATINLTYWHGPWPDIAKQTTRFAQIVKELRDEHGLSAIRFITLQNEPNLHKFDKDKLAEIYRGFDAAARKIGLRDQVQLVGGDLVQDDQRQWFEHLAKHQPFLDGYSVHIYWDYWDTAKLQRRISEVPRIVGELPKPARKPIYVTEFGVRGKHEPGVDDPGAYETPNGPRLTDMPLHGMQVAWFMMEAIDRGCVATVQWDAYVASYGREMRYGIIGSAKDGWPLRPAYHVLRTFTHTTQPGWRAVRVEGEADDALVVATRGSNAAEMTVYALNRADRPREITVAGLGPQAKLHTLVWNGDGKGTVAPGDAMNVAADGAITLKVGARSLVALCTIEPKK
jgi:hypothetical protein